MARGSSFGGDCQWSRAWGTRCRVLQRRGNTRRFTAEMLKVSKDEPTARSIKLPHGDSSNSEVLVGRKAHHPMLGLLRSCRRRRKRVPLPVSRSLFRRQQFAPESSSCPSRTEQRCKALASSQALIRREWVGFSQIPPINFGLRYNTVAMRARERYTVNPVFRPPEKWCQPFQIITLPIQVHGW
jgi:hypothetical protein